MLDHAMTMILHIKKLSMHINVIKKRFVEIVALVLVLIPQVAHTVYLFKTNSHYPDPWFAWCYAIGVDMAILIFTVRGWIWTALAYLLATLAHNMAYQFLPQSDFSAVLIGISLSGTIFSFSHVFYTGRNSQNTDVEKPKEALISERIVYALARGVSFEVQAFRCPCCSLSFPTAKQLNGHISGHKMRQEWQEHMYGDWKKENEKRHEAIGGLQDELIGLIEGSKK